MKKVYLVAIVSLMTTTVLLGQHRLYADDNPAPAAPPDATPTIHPLQGLKVMANYVDNLATSNNDGNIEVSYKGHDIFSRGTAPAQANPVNEFITNQAAPATAPDLQFDFISGTTATTGLLKFLGANRLALKPLKLYPFAAVARLDTQINHTQGDAAFFIETPSYSPIRVGAANWINFGAGVEEVWGKAAGQSAKSTTTGILTYRTYFGYTHAVPTDRRQFTFADIQKWAGTKEELKKFSTYPAINPTPPIPPSTTSPTTDTGNIPLNKFLIGQADAVFQSGNIPINGKPTPQSETNTQDGYEAHITKAYHDEQKAYSLMPRDAAWLESDGKYEFAENPGGPRFKYLLAPSVAHFFTLGDKETQLQSFVQLRYETGWDWADQTSYIRRVFVSTGFVF